MERWQVKRSPMEGHEVEHLALLAVLAALMKLQQPVVHPFDPQLCCLSLKRLELLLFV